MAFRVMEQVMKINKKGPSFEEDGPGEPACLGALAAVHLDMHKSPPTRRAVTVMCMMMVLAVRWHILIRLASRSGRVKMWRGRGWRPGSL